MSDDQEYDHDTRVRRLKNAVRRHGAVESIVDFRDHGDVVYLDVVFTQGAVPSGMMYEFNGRLVTAFQHYPDQGFLRRIFGHPPVPKQAAVIAVPLEVEERVTR